MMLTVLFYIVIHMYMYPTAIIIKLLTPSMFWLSFSSFTCAFIPCNFYSNITPYTCIHFIEEPGVSIEFEIF